jgi:hypothetical protein
MSNEYNFMGGKHEKDHFEDLGVDGRIILKFILQKSSRDWNHLAQETMVMNLRVP